MTMTMASRIWFNTTQAAEFSGYHVDTIRKALEAGHLVGSQRKVGGHWRISRTDLDAWIRGEAA